ncbi:MAG: cell wall-active antibiotics response protein [Tannerella sp.]|jgi:predicted membrane protein|nr:cell wall-active antibiotics response protein [Tannerella sp.]
MNANKTLLLLVLSLVLMIGSGVLLEWSLNDLTVTSTVLTVVTLSLTSVFLFIIGAAMAGYSVGRSSAYGQHGLNNSVAFALTVVAAGALMLCFNIGVFNPVWKGFFFSWPMLLFVIGAIGVCRFHFITGIIIVAAGKFFLFDKAAAMFPGDVPFENFVGTYWPVFFIVAGVVILLCVIIKPSRKCRNGERWKENFKPTSEQNKDGKIDMKFVFSGTEYVILDPVFYGGNIEVVFGGMELDLRRTTLPEGETFLYVKSVFGGVVITAPDTWDIEIRSNSFAGGSSDSRVKNIDKDKTRRLIILAKSTFGGVDVK